MTGRRAVGAWSVVAAITLVLPRLLPGGWTSLLGPIATTWLWLPPLAWAVASLLTDDEGRAAWTLRLTARLALWTLVVMILIDPTHNAPDVLSETAGATGAWAGSTIRWAVGGLIVLVIAGVVLGSLVGGSSAPPPRRPWSEQAVASTRWSRSSCEASFGSCSPRCSARCSSACGLSRGRWMGATASGRCAAGHRLGQHPDGRPHSRGRCLRSCATMVGVRPRAGQRRLGSQQGGARRMGPSGHRRARRRRHPSRPSLADGRETLRRRARAPRVLRRAPRRRGRHPVRRTTDQGRTAATSYRPP